MYDERDSCDPPLSAELTALERQLAAMVPAPPRVERDELMFAAGRASAVGADARCGVRQRLPDYIAGPSWAGTHVWQATTTLATAASIVLATMLVWQRPKPVQTAMSPAKAERIDTVAAEFDHRSWSDHMPSGYLGVRQVALSLGIAALDYEWPTTGATDSDTWSPPATARQLRDELLPKPKQSNAIPNPARIL